MMFLCYSWLGKPNVTLWSSDGYSFQCHQSVLGQFHKEFRPIFQAIKCEEDCNFILADVQFDDLENILKEIYHNVDDQIPLTNETIEVAKVGLDQFNEIPEDTHKDPGKGNIKLKAELVYDDESLTF